MIVRYTERMELIENYRFSYDNCKENEVQEIFNKSVGNVQNRSSEPSSRIASSLNISEVTSCLFLCSATSVHTSSLQLLGITCIINAAIELPDLPVSENIAYYRVNVQDSPHENIKDFFEETAEIIHKVESSGGKILLHCIAGISRSASLCIAYLMKCHKFSLRDAFNYLKLKRPIIRPNCGFFRQLIDYERELFGCNSILMVYNNFLNLEVPDVYDSEYKNPFYFNKCRNVRRD